MRKTLQSLRSDTPDWQPWLMFLMRSMQQQKRRLAAKVELEKIEFTTLPELAIQILDYVRDHGRVTSRDIVRVAGASPNTLKTLFSRLVSKG